jgi:L-iditol 2-dehydrogenase
MTDTMQSLVWTAPCEMQMQMHPVPAPAPGEVLIRVTVAGICGSELGGYLGKNSLRVPPLVMGHEAAGVIAASGEPRLPVGTRVTFNPLVTCGECRFCREDQSNLCPRRQLIGAHRPGAFAEYVAVPARQVWPLLPEMPDTAGALAEPLAFAVRCVAHLRAGRETMDGESVLILGAGAIGLLCVAVARREGLGPIIVSDTQAGRLSVAAAWGATHTLDATQGAAAGRVREIVAEGVEHVIDAVGADATREDGLRALRPGGTMVFAGLHAEASPIPANYVIRQELRIQGCFAYAQGDYAEAMDLLAEGEIPFSGEWIEERPLAQGGAAFADLVAGRARTTKIMLRVAPDRA